MIVGEKPSSWKSSLAGGSDEPRDCAGRCGVGVGIERDGDRHRRRLLERVERDVLELTADRRRLLLVRRLGELADALRELPDERRRGHRPAPVRLDVVVDTERGVQALEERLDEERAVSGRPSASVLGVAAK